MDCLVQPPITFVNVQTRLETLPIFYAINKFHFETSNFGGLGSNDSFVEWWRVTGDTNLRFIRSFSIFVGTFLSGIMMRHRQPQVGDNITSTNAKAEIHCED
jgi:hypothetical protein